MNSYVCKRWNDDRELILLPHDKINVRFRYERSTQKTFTIKELTTQFPDDQWNFRVCNTDSRGIQNAGVSGTFCELVKHPQFADWYFGSRRPDYYREFWLEAYPWTAEMAIEAERRWEKQRIEWQRPHWHMQVGEPHEVRE